MILTSLTLRQFRNHRELTLDVDPGVNLFLGSNGAGKTNLMEAIAVLTTGLSPRGAETESLVEWGTEGFFLKGVFISPSQSVDGFSLEMKYKGGSPRVIRQNGDTPLRLRDLLGKVPLVSFVPEDLSLVKGEPDLRRQALNMILLQVNPVYAEALRAYTEIVRSRNAALKQVAAGDLGADALEPWDLNLIEKGLPILQARQDFLTDFSRRTGDIHRRLSGGKETLELVYEPSFAGPWDQSAIERWHDKIIRMRPQELALGSTLVGPHRDNFSFLLNGRNARPYGSEGQKRTCAVSFKLAEIPFIQEKLGQKPLCLLDDVLSELDAHRASHLLDELSQTGQCFVTMTGLESWPKGRALPATVFQVSSSGVVLDEALSKRSSHHARHELETANV